MPEKIFINARFLTQQITGVQRFAIELSRQLVKLYGTENLEFIAPHNVIQQEIAKELNVKIIGKRTGYFWEQIELPRYLKKCGSPKLVNFCNVAPLFYKNNYVAIHDVMFARFPKTYSKSFTLIYNLMIPTLCKKAKKIFTVSEFSKNEIAELYHVSQGKLAVIYNAVDAQFTNQSEKSLKAEKYFFAVSSVKFTKNFPVILESFELAQKENPEIKLFIAGMLSASNFQKLDLSKYQTNKNIQFLGRISDNDLVRYYSNAIGFIFPSIYEGFGIPPLEAQACKCPVIASNISVLKEVLGKSALFCDPNDIQGFANKMNLIAKNQEVRENLILQGLQNVTRFSWKSSGEKLLEEVLKG